MTNGLGLVPADTPDPTGPAGAPATPLEALARRRAELHAAQTKTFVVPGYEGIDIGDRVADLVARFRRLDVDEFRNAMFRTDLEVVDRNASFLIDSLEGLYWRVTGDDGTRLLPLNDGVESGWHDIAPFLGADLGPDATAIDQLVDGVFAENEVAMTDFAGDVGQWMQAGQRDADQEFLGGH